MDWLSKAPVSEVTVCVMLSLFTQVIFVPAGILTLAGVKAKFLMVICVTTSAFVPDAVVCIEDVVVVPEDAVELEDPQETTPTVPAATRSNTTIRNNIFFIHVLPTATG